MFDYAFWLIVLVAACWICVIVDELVAHAKHERRRLAYLRRLQELEDILNRVDREHKEGGSK